jgi:hypothetical protein
MPAMDDDRDGGSREDGAVFAPTIVRQARGPRVLAALVAIALGGLIAIGALDRGSTPEMAAVPVATGGPTASLRAQTARSSRAPIASRLPTTPQERSERMANGMEVPASPGNDDIMSVDIRPAGSHLFIHGDVFSLDVVRVAVSLEDALGHVAAHRTVDVPGGRTAFMLGAVHRFDVHFFLPDEVQADGFVISTTALDAHGNKIETLMQWVARSPEMM